MLKFSIQLFGGRGGASGRTSNAVGGGGRVASHSIGRSASAVKSFSSKQIGAMSRSQAVAAARSIFIRSNMKSGLSRQEATRRFNGLVDGNTTAQLKKYIKRNQ